MHKFVKSKILFPNRGPKARVRTRSVRKLRCASKRAQFQPKLDNSVCYHTTFSFQSKDDGNMTPESLSGL